MFKATAAVPECTSTTTAAVPVHEIMVFTWHPGTTGTDGQTLERAAVRDLAMAFLYPYTRYQVPGIRYLVLCTSHMPGTWLVLCTSYCCSSQPAQCGIFVALVGALVLLMFCPCVSLAPLSFRCWCLSSSVLLHTSCFNLLLVPGAAAAVHVNDKSMRAS